MGGRSLQTYFKTTEEAESDDVRQFNKRRKGKRVSSTQIETLADWVLTWNANWDCHMG
jgi:hypothetical protein